MLRGSAVQLGSQLGDRRFVNALVGPLLSRRRHLAGTKLSDDAFPGICVAAQVFLADALEIQSALLHFVIVATDTIGV